MFTSHDGRLRLRLAARASPTSSGSRSRPARSSGASRWRATAPTTWRSRPTARGCSCPTRRRARCTCSTPRTGARGRRVRVGRLAAREQLLRRRQADLPRQHRHRSTRRPTSPSADSTKGDRWFQIVDAKTLQGARAPRHRAEARRERLPGHDAPRCARWRSRPASAIVYFQVSFLHGFVEFDLGRTDKPLRIAEPADQRGGGEHAARAVPARLGAPRPGDEPRGHEALRRRDDVRLRGDRAPRRLRVQDRSRSASKPYWSTNSARRALLLRLVQRRRRGVGDLDYASEQEVARIPVGDHPQRMRMGLVRSDAIGGLHAVARRRRHRAPRKPAKLRIARARVAGGRLDMRLGMTSRATGRVRAVYRSAAAARASRSGSRAHGRRRSRGRSAPAPARAAPQDDGHPHAHLRRQRARAAGPAALAGRSAPRSPTPG